MSKCVAVLSHASSFFNTAHLCEAKTWDPKMPLKPTAAEIFSSVLAQRSFPPMPLVSAPPCLVSSPKQVLELEGQLEVGCSPSMCEALGPCTTTEQSLGPNFAWMKERGKNRPWAGVLQVYLAGLSRSRGRTPSVWFSQDEWRIPEYTTDLGRCQNTGLTCLAREPEDPLQSQRISSSERPLEKNWLTSEWWIRT